MYAAAHHWVRYLSAAEAAGAVLGPAAYLVVRYEDLVSNPERELRRICALLGEEYSPAMLGYHREDVPYPTDDRNSRNLKRPVLGDSSGKWRTGLTLREQRIIEAVASDHLQRYGYPVLQRRPS